MQQTKNAEIKYHESIDNLTMSKFKECFIHGNISALIISGYPAEDDLLKAWENIKNQYSERAGGEEYQLYISIYKEVSILKIKIDQVQVVVGRENKEDGIRPGLMRLCYDDYFAYEINKLFNTNVKFERNDHDAYIKQLDGFVNRGKAFKIKYDLANMKFEALEKRHQKNGNLVTINEEYFDTILVTLSDFAKFHIDDSIKMSEYFIRLKKLNNFIKTQKR